MAAKRRANAGGAPSRPADAYSSWGQSVVQRGDDWARTAHYSDDRGTVAGFRTSEGAAGVAGSGQGGSTGGVVRSADGDLYVGKDGEVYRRNDEGWAKHSGGSGSGWESVDGIDAPRTTSQRSTDRSTAQDRPQRTETQSSLQHESQRRADGARRSTAYSQGRSRSSGGGGRRR